MRNGKHGKEAYFIDGQIRTTSADGQIIVRSPSHQEMSSEFRFTRITGRQGIPNSDALISQLAVAMTFHVGVPAAFSADVPAGYTYLGQFVDHDMVLDPSELDLKIQSVDSLRSLRSPSLDLDSLYGRGPTVQPWFYQDDGVSLREGGTVDVTPGSNASADGGRGFDVPRWGQERGGSRKQSREARIPDIRNDENLAVAQVHCIFIRLHNKLVRELKGTVADNELFDTARQIATLHYQHMLITDYLPRIVKSSVLDDVFTHGRKVLDTDVDGQEAEMPVEFSGAAFRLGHSMIRTSYEWNRLFNSTPGSLDPGGGHLFRLFRFCGTSGSLVPTQHLPGTQEDIGELMNIAEAESGAFLGHQLPSNWVADWLRMFDMSRFGPAFTAAPGDFNQASRIDPHIVDPLAHLPPGSFGPGGAVLQRDLNLAFRNLARGRMLGLPSGQQLAEDFQARGVALVPLGADEIVRGLDVVHITEAELKPEQIQELQVNTPLWFYVLREAEFSGGHMDGVGARIVAETFHRAIESSRHSVLTPGFRVSLGPGQEDNRFNMEDLLHYAFDGRADMLNPF